VRRLEAASRDALESSYRFSSLLARDRPPSEKQAVREPARLCGTATLRQEALAPRVFRAAAHLLATVRLTHDMTVFPRLLNGRTGQPPVPLYDLPLWALDVERFPDGGIHGQGWRVGAKTILVPPLRDEATFYAHLSSMRERYPHYAVNYIFDPKSENQSRAAPQIYAEARSRRTAQRACDLIRASLMLIDGGPTFFLDDQTVIPRIYDTWRASCRKIYCLPAEIRQPDLTFFSLRGSRQSYQGESIFNTLPTNCN
jgi:hypothetical protein